MESNLGTYQPPRPSQWCCARACLPCREAASSVWLHWLRRFWSTSRLPLCCPGNTYRKGNYECMHFKKTNAAVVQPIPASRRISWRCPVSMTFLYLVVKWCEGFQVETGLNVTEKCTLCLFSKHFTSFFFSVRTASPWITIFILKLGVSSIRKTMFVLLIIHISHRIQLTMGVYFRLCHDLLKPIIQLLPSFKSVLLSAALSHRFGGGSSQTLLRPINLQSPRSELARSPLLSAVHPDLSHTLYPIATIRV